MGLVEKTKEAFFKAVDRVGGRLVRLQEKTGVSYPVINQLNSGKKKFKDLSLQTVEKLFPEMDITFFRDERHTAIPPDLDLTAIERKVFKIIRELEEEQQLDILAEAAAIRGRHSKNVRDKVRKAG